ncbi:hypothetical protein M426DRAFT_90238 [Hypoxylon sp. CI-4A]|nr:hypothetical protein M426DRAFT_90238 [Hypoxylon sp. CI-4A]
MAFCTYCGQQFQRNEHLERHLLTHTNVKRFKCSICHISFSRGDVLQKHLAIHGDVGTDGTATSKDSPLGPVRIRARTQTACRNCAKMKAKCDSNSPCNRCRSKHLSCDRQPKRARTGATTTSSQSQRARSDGDRNSAELANSHESETVPYEAVAGQENGSSGDRPGSESRFNPEQQQPQKELDIMMDSDTFINYADAVSGQAGLMTQEPTSLIPNVSSLVEWPTAQPIDTTHHLDQDAPNHGLASAATGVRGFGQGQSDSPPNVELQASITQSINEPLEHPAVLEGRDHWNSFRCNPKKDIINCPRTAGAFLESLSHMPKYDRLWSWFDLDYSSTTFAGAVVSMPLLESTRDALSAISQAFLRTALEVHKLDPAAASVDAASPSADISRGFLVLPPAATLEYFLGEYMRLFEPFYKLVPGGVLDANSLVSGGSNSRAATLLILLMISQAAGSDPTSEGRRLSAGLTEVCRISLYNLIEKDISASHHHFPVHSALLFITQAAWSGDKWLMDISLGQRSIYISMVRNAGLLDIGESYSELDSGDWELSRARWIERERIIRLAYAWVQLDLELSLFQDENLHIPVLAMNSSLPSSEELWLAPDTSSWQQLFARDDDSGVGPYSTQPMPQPSLRTLFQWFLNDDPTLNRQQHLSPFILRLLLHPLHALVYSCRQLLDSLGEVTCSRSFSPITKASTHVRMHEIRSLLHRWLNLYKASLSVSDSQDSVLVISTLIIYHAINLNTVVSISDIEELARRELSDREIRHYSQDAASLVHSPKEAIFHSGRILNLLRALDKKTRPPWWPAALYRATLALWACSVFYGPLWASSSSSSYLLIDDQDGDNIDYYSWNLVRGTSKDEMIASPWDSRSPPFIPAFKHLTGTGSPVTLEHPGLVLETCLLVFDHGVSTRVSEGIRGKLQQLLRRRADLNNK